MRRRVSTACVLIASLIFSACSSAAPGSPSPGAQSAEAPSNLADTMVIAVADAPSHLDRQIFAGSSGLVNVMLGYNVAETLFKTSPEGDPTPYLAESWEVTEPGTMRFKLREGVTFSDGEPWNADAAKVNFDRMMTLEGGAWKNEFETVNEVTVVDEYTIDIAHDPDPAFPKYFNLVARMFSPKQIQEAPDSIATGPIGTGAYTVTSFDANGLVLEARDDYWGKTPSLKNVTFVFRPEPGARVAMLLAGEADLILDLQPDDVGQLDPSQVVPGVGFETYTLRYGFDDELTSDPRIREAINLAIDREQLLQLFSGYADLPDGNQLWPSWVTGWAERPAVPFDRARATALVEEAGATGKELELGTGVGRWLYMGEVAEAVAAMIEQTGLEVSLFKGTHDYYKEQARVLEPAIPGLFGAMGWENGEALENISSKLTCNSEQSTYCNEEFVALALEARAEPDPEKRTVLVQQLVDILDEDLPYSPLLTPQILYGKNPNLTFTFLPGGLLSLPDMELAR